MAPLVGSRILDGKRILVKVGSSTLLDLATGRVKKAWLESLVDDIVVLRKSGKEVLLVSSGAVYLGKALLANKGKAKVSIAQKQAAASVGLVTLADAWSSALAKQGLTMGLVLLTIGDTEERTRHLNVRGALQALLSKGVVPLINENDPVATSRLRFGDNDRLAARIATMVGVEKMIVLSDINGLYTDYPHSVGVEHIPVVEEVTPDIEAMAGGPKGTHAQGGMQSKVSAAKFCMEGGCSLVLCKGDEMNPLQKLAGGGRHTLFLSSVKVRTARKKWLSGMINNKGSIEIDDGAAIALKQGNSLLPSGIVGVVGDFLRGDVVQVFDRMQTLLAIGLCGYDASEVRVIKGIHSKEIEQVLGYVHAQEVIHRDDMALMLGRVSKGM